MTEWKPPTALKLAVLWICVMFLYIYGDYFYLYAPGKIEAIMAGRLGPLRGYDEQGVALISLLMLFPAIMPAISLIAPHSAAKWTNFVFGLAYSAILALTMPGAPLFYLIYGVLEIALTLSIALIAWRWTGRAG